MSGSVYFYANSVSWSFQSKLFAPDAAGTDYFGFSVSLGSGNVLFVGADLDDDTAADAGMNKYHSLSRLGLIPVIKL